MAEILNNLDMLGMSLYSWLKMSVTLNMLWVLFSVPLIALLAWSRIMIGAQKREVSTNSDEDIRAQRIQFESGDMARAAIEKAVAKNQSAHLLPDDTEGDAGPMTVNYYPGDMDRTFTIKVSMAGTNPVTGERHPQYHRILDFMVSGPRRHLYVNWHPSGPKMNSDIADLKSVLMKVCKLLENYFLYQRKPDGSGTPTDKIE